MKIGGPSLVMMHSTTRAKIKTAMYKYISYSE